jgi:uncharacterized membrane protein
MPTLTRWLIRTALLWLLMSLVLGVAIAAPDRLGLPPALAGLRPTWVHFIVVGWITQLIFGVAYWMFPRHSLSRPRGLTALGWAGYALLNVGLALRVAGEVLTLFGHPQSLAACSAPLQMAAGWSLAAMIWPRVKEK